MINISGVFALDCSETLRRGQSGSNVLKLQKKLNNVMGCNLSIDGIFGSKTYACVVKFQDKYNLTSDGIVGSKTCNKLNGVTASSSTSNASDDLQVVGSKNVIVIEDTYVRSGMSMKDEALKMVKTGDVISYVTSSNNWYKVKVNSNNYGYIKSSYVKKNFIVVDISLQKLVFYKNGQTILDTNVITGRKSKHDTPVGVYNLNVSNKETNRTLRGKNDNGSSYASHVDYWMPFIMSRGIGFHDASWREESEFDDSTYIYNGSHGCVNMRGVDAKKMYNNLNSNVTVVIRK
jgi:peptidoglycan hydrolase-like protein with peptidoglycan-binding domain